ncbi:DUF4062 domain-containing protein [Acinetobacter sp. ANC 7200]|uniref:DUF4062 domain-containing protein n=1 Tax=Acinetobacter amyesii TaxID=2942470 RepID=UPI0020BEB455|nr:DUF4062 domain-containing protein [Acinetobacter amyesii]MCL6245835.1 DUF4062 domain-containing protein [Acinetobacter amyesii]
MAGLKVFVSSTCYDLSLVRTQLRTFIQALGHNPIMSDYNDFLYDHRNHTHTSCINEVQSVDVIVVIVGSRFGGDAIKETFDSINFDKLINENFKFDDLINKCSVTQAEVFKASELNIPIYAFVDQNVWHDHELYLKNKKNTAIIDQIFFPAIEKQETARYIFEFIDFLRKKSNNNAIFTFSKVQDIEDTLRNQWASLFQKLLKEDKERTAQVKRIDDLTEKFEELRTSLVNTLMNDQQRAMADAIVEYKDLVNFIQSFGKKYVDELIQQTLPDWTQLLNAIGIQETLDIKVKNSEGFSEAELLTFLPVLETVRDHGVRPSSIIFLNSEHNGFYWLLESTEYYEKIIADYEQFRNTDENLRQKVVNAITEIDFNKHVLKFLPLKTNIRYTASSQENSSNLSKSLLNDVLQTSQDRDD